MYQLIPSLVGGWSLSAPSGPKYQVRAVVARDGEGREVLLEARDRGRRESRFPWATCRRRCRTAPGPRGRFSKAARAALYVGIAWIGSSGSVTRSDCGESHRRLVDDRGCRPGERHVHDGRLVSDEQLQEVVPAVEGVRVERVDVCAVGEGEPLLTRPGEVLDQFRAVSPRLLVLPLAGHEDRHLDLVDEGDGVQWVGDRRVVVRVGRDLRVSGRPLRRGALGWPAHVVSPAWICWYAQGCPLLGPAGSASYWRCCAQATAKPVLRMPPGYSVVAVASMVESGEIASRSGGSSCAVNSWLIAPYEMPIIPTLWSSTHGWWAIVSMTSYPSRF